MSAFRRLPSPLRRAAVHAGAPSYTVGAVALLRRPGGDVLLVEQRHTPGWALPGGLLRRGESAQDALVREVGEEVAVRLAAPSLPVPAAVVTPDVRRVDVVFTVDVDGDVRPRREDPAEVQRVGWFALDALPDVSRPTADILRALQLR
jgi:ADP-ribose pyrophosphatase YjhB (NUDIX family)